MAKYINKMNAEQKIDEYLNRASDWRTAVLKGWRELIHQVYPEVKEEWKWNSPVFTRDGSLVCSLGLFKSHVSLTFFHGHQIEDPKGLFRADSTAKKLRSVQCREGDVCDEAALLPLLHQAFSL